MIIKSKDLMACFMKKVFGSMTLNEAKWPVYLKISRDYFSTRAKQEESFNQRTVDNLQRLYQCALEGDVHCGFSPMDISFKISCQLSSLLDDKSLMFLEYKYTDSEEIKCTKRANILTIIRFLSSMAIGQKEVDLQIAAKKYRTDYKDIVRYCQGQSSTHISPTISIHGMEASRIISKRINFLDDTHFSGREDSLEALHEKLNSRGQCLVSGMGGIGKSEFVRKYISRYRQCYSQIVWLSYEDSLIQTFASDSKLQIKGVERADYSYENDRQYAERKLRILFEEATDRILVVLDNFDVDHDELIDDFLSGSYSLIITSRIKNNLRGKVEEELKLEALSDSDIMKVFQTFYHESGGIKSNEEILCDESIQDIIYRIFDRHTLSVIMAAQILPVTRINGHLLTTEQLRDCLAKDHLQSDDESDIHKKILINIDSMLRLASLSEDELYFLKNLALVSISGISVHDICTLSGFSQVKGYDLIIDGLIRRHLILYDRVHDQVSLHVLIRTSVLNRVENNETTFDTFVKSIWDKYDFENPVNTAEDKERNYQWAAAAESVFPKEHYQYYYLRKAKLFLLAALLPNEALEELERIEYPDKKEHMRIKAKCAQILFSIGNAEKAYSILRSDYQKIKSIPVEKWGSELGLSYYYIVERLPDIYRVRREYKNALDASILALHGARYYSPLRKVAEGWVNTHMVLIYRELDDLENAKKCLKNAEACFKNESMAGLRWCCELKGIILADELRFEEASLVFSKAEEMIQSQLPTNHTDIAKFYIFHGDLYMRECKFTEAICKYNKALSIMKLHNIEHFITLIKKRIQYAELEIVPQIINTSSIT